MVANREQYMTADVTHLEIVWRNPVTFVQTRLRLREASNPYYGWAEQAGKIRARRSNWNRTRPWAA
jgi:hypothetical protein